MNFPFFVARRYFFSGRKRNFIQILSIISMLGVGVGTMALIIVLSAFNGLEDVIRTMFNTFDPQLKITALKGKSFDTSPEFINRLRQVPGIAYVTEVAEDNALLKYREGQMVVKVKGVSDNFVQQQRIDSNIVDGVFRLHDAEQDRAILGAGIASAFQVVLDDPADAIQLWYPKASLKTGLNPEKAFYRRNIIPGSVFQIEDQFDSRYVFVPLAFASDLFACGTKRNSIEIKLKPGTEIEPVQQSLQALLGAKFLVQNSDEQHAGLMRILKIEKLFVFLALSFIVVIASFNIFVSLGMLAIDKKRDISVMFALGATQQHIRRIFLLEAVLVAFTGATVGMVLGYAVCAVQKQFGLVGMGMESAVIQAYPVKMLWSDFFLIAGFLVLITLGAGVLPANRAAKGMERV
ncbi:MAG: FtsX-like permease family protein [Bacteroidota bacterium]